MLSLIKSLLIVFFVLTAICLWADVKVEGATNVFIWGAALGLGVLMGTLFALLLL